MMRRSRLAGRRSALTIVLCAAIPGGHAMAAAPIAARSLGLRTGTVDTSREVNEWGALRMASKFGARYVLQLDGPMDPERQARLADAGVLLSDYLPENAYIVTLDEADPRALAELEFVRWGGVFRKAWKLAPELGRRAFQTPERQALAGRGELAVEVTLFAGIPSDGAIGAIQTLDGSVIHRTTNVAGHEVVAATVRTLDAAKLADIEEVQFVEEAPELTVRNDTNRWIVQSNVAAFFPVYDHGIHGEGQIIGIIDQRVDRNHCAFEDDIDNTPGPQHRKIEAYNTSFGAISHGTHVAGICIGDAGADDNTRGIAYQSRMVYNDIPPLPFTEDDTKDRLELHHLQGARIHTNSWGDDGTVAYNGLAHGIDVFSYENEDDLVLFAVTNTSTLKNPENAKNLLAVGASQDTPNQGNFCSGGSGPTNDGRRKPEIYAPGCSTNSAFAGTVCSTTPSTGTSMASPAVAAAGLLARQYFVDGFYPTGAAVPGNGFTPTGALVKAVLLNSSVDMPGVTGYPSDREGWGRVLLDKTLYFPCDAAKLFVDDVRNADGLSTSEDLSYELSVRTGTPLHVTLVWTEPAGALNANPAYVNDLNLELVGPDGTYKGNVFGGGQSTAGGVADNKNNVEQVQLPAPAAGDYTIWVRGTSVVQGTGIPFRQGYALVVSGDVAEALPTPAATMIGASSLKVHTSRGSQALALNLTGRVDDHNISSESREGGISELRIEFDTTLLSGVTTLAGGAVTIDEQQTGDPNAGTSAGYAPSAYAGNISTACSSGNELVLSFAPGLPNATTYRIRFGDQVTSIAGQQVEVRALQCDVDNSGKVHGTDRSLIVSVWTGSGYTAKTDVNLSGTTNGGDRSEAVAAWTGAENTAP